MEEKKKSWDGKMGNKPMSPSFFTWAQASTEPSKRQETLRRRTCNRLPETNFGQEVFRDVARHGKVNLLEDLPSAAPKEREWV